MVAQVAVGKTPRQETEHQQALSSACTATSAKRRPLARCPSTSIGSLTPWNASSPSAILADPLDVQETSIGLKADPP